MSDNLEIERRFLAKAELQYRDARIITQIYLQVGDPEVRVTQSLPTAQTQPPSWTKLTVKTGSGLVRNETDIDIPREAYEVFMWGDFPNSIQKVRERVGRWEIDYYEWPLTGLIVAEIELESEDEELPELPEGITLLKEVTGDSTYSDGRLSTLTEEEAIALVQAVRSEYGEEDS